MRIGLAGLPILPNRTRTPFEVEEELQFHIEMLELKYAQQGVSAADAKAAALKRFGNLERIKQQCVDISRRNSLLRRILKMSAIPIALIGLSIRIFSSEYQVARIGGTLIMIAIAGRLLLYAHGLRASTFFSRTKETPLSVVTVTPEKARNSQRRTR